MLPPSKNSYTLEHAFLFAFLKIFLPTLLGSLNFINKDKKLQEVAAAP
jgi:hypothetical protein